MRTHTHAPVKTHANTEAQAPRVRNVEHRGLMLRGCREVTRRVKLFRIPRAPETPALRRG